MFLNKKLFLLLITIVLQGSLILPAVSIAQVSINALSKNDSIINNNKKDDNYREIHKNDWWKFPLNNFKYYDTKTRYTFPLILEGYKDKDLTCINMFVRDTLVYTTATTGEFDIITLKTYYVSLKNCEIPQEFLYHMKIFKDSLMTTDLSIPFVVEHWNSINNKHYYSNIKKIAPFGFVDEWSWSKKYSNLSFSIKYTNTNSKTIKYLTVYFKATNGVGDVRKIGHFQGTGPLEEWETGTWDFDYSDYYVAGDTNHMTITKIVITYMNGSKKILTKNKIIYK